ncbi:MAG TPA: hypothetical protein VEK57_01365 [Thermoanaerobaculia bacterium]|nr:hypothetical protein [Thermoanaerobaculia bacterium]
MRVLVLLLLFAVSTHGEELKPGPYTAGFTQWERYDHARIWRTARTLDGKPRTGERARPVRISIWYPAQAAEGAPLTFGDYVGMLGAEARFGTVTPEQQRRAEETLWAFPLVRTLTPEQRGKLRALPSRAYRDAKPVSGKFPVILYSLGSPAVHHGTPEYLASHGYVVVQAPRLGAFAGFPQDNRDALDLETKLRDMDFVLNELGAWPQADPSNMAAIGFSAGGRWALAAAMKYPDVRAVVSLDSVMLFNDAVTAAWRSMPHFDLEAVRVPVLHLTRTAFAKQDDRKMWEAMRYADRTYVTFEEPSLDHWDFQSLGYEMALVGARGENAGKVAEAYQSWNRQTLAFLDAHLKGKKLERLPDLPAEPAPVSAAAFMNALEEEGTEAAIAAYRAAWKERGIPPVAEAVVNVAGYTLLFGGRGAEGLKLLALNAEAHPSSSNTWDSLADAYLAVGERGKALELTKKASELLDADKGMSEERRAAVRGSIEGKLKQLQ